VEEAVIPGTDGPRPILRYAGARIALSGATGFVGRVLCAELVRRGFAVLPISRADLEAMRAGTDDKSLLAGCACAVHLAARAHVLHETEADPSATFRVSNRDLTLAFAKACSKAGVERFVFVSSIGVNGSSSVRPFRPEDEPAPDEPYAVSKLDAELGLWAFASAGARLDVVVVRPPLVYGPDAKGNFLRLLKLAANPLPLPLGDVKGRRSFISVWNLSDLLIRCIQHPDAAGRTFLASDGEDIDLPDLLRIVSSAMGRRPRIVPVPKGFLRFVTNLLGRRREFDKLAGSLQVDISETCRALDWRPPVELRDGLTRTAQWYVERGTAQR
jgi:nucleoside-diphosphate-sugar epimerase